MILLTPPFLFIPTRNYILANLKDDPPKKKRAPPIFKKKKKNLEDELNESLEATERAIDKDEPFQFSFPFTDIF